MKFYRSSGRKGMRKSFSIDNMTLLVHFMNLTLSHLISQFIVILEVLREICISLLKEGNILIIKEHIWLANFMESENDSRIINEDD